MELFLFGLIEFGLRFHESALMGWPERASERVDGGVDLTVLALGTGRTPGTSQTIFTNLSTCRYYWSRP